MRWHAFGPFLGGRAVTRRFPAGFSVALQKTDTNLNDGRTIGDARTARVGGGGYDVLSIRFLRRFAVSVQIRRIVIHGGIEGGVPGALFLVAELEVTGLRPIQHLVAVLDVRVVGGNPIRLLGKQGSSQKQNAADADSKPARASKPCCGKWRGKWCVELRD